MLIAKVFDVLSLAFQIRNHEATWLGSIRTFFKAKQASAGAVCSAIFTASDAGFPGIRTDCEDSAYSASTVQPWAVPPTSAARVAEQVIPRLELHPQNF